MNFTLSDDHLALRDAARSFLDKEVDLAPLLVPGATVAQAGYDRLWAQVAELGWPGIVVPEVYGGLGMDYLDLIMVVGEMGRMLAPMPFLGTLAGIWAILAGADDAQKAEWLAPVAAGTCKLALAVADSAGNYESTDVRVASAGEGFALTGTRSFVVDAAAADRILVAADLDGVRRWFLVDAGAPRVAVDLVEWRDITRQVGTLTLDGAPAQLLGGSDPAAIWPFVRDRLYLVLAAESAAGAEAALHDAVGYAKERVAFGRPIGAFQAIKHQLAEVAGECECAAVGVQYAAWALSADDPRASLAAAMAQSYASIAYANATHRNIQIFGAIGFTWEMKNHLFYKRARCNAALLGEPAQQREEVIRFLEREAA